MADPLSADRLVQILRAEGLEVHEYRSWRTHNRNHKGAWGPINGVMIHHTVTRGTAGSVRLCYEGHSTLPGPLCHGVIAKDGSVHLVGNGRANHAGLGDNDVLDAVIAERDLPRDNEANVDGNARFYGFECINLGDGQDPWPDVQLDAIEKAAAAICRAYGWAAESVLGHLEWQPGKIDPRGFGMDWMRQRVQARLNNPPNQQEDDMPSAAEIADAVWNWDGIEPLDPTESNPRHQVENVLTEVLRRLDRTERAANAGNAAITELARALGSRDHAVDVDALIARIEDAIANITATVTVDVNEGNPS